jgi:hypothetical protein
MHCLNITIQVFLLCDIEMSPGKITHKKFVNNEQYYGQEQRITRDLNSFVIKGRFIDAPLRTPFQIR